MYLLLVTRQNTATFDMSVGVNYTTDSYLYQTKANAQNYKKKLVEDLRNKYAKSNDIQVSGLDNDELTHIFVKEDENVIEIRISIIEKEFMD